MKNKNLKIIESYSNEVEPIIDIENFNVWFNDSHVLNNVNVSIKANKINCIIGPSGSGKTTLIRSINRINDDMEGYTFDGNIKFNNHSIYDNTTDITKLRTEIGMVFQKPCVFPRSISQNVLFGIQHHKRLQKHERLQLVENNLKAVSLWKEVSHRLDDKADSLSIGQQQRLCIARTLSVNPKVLLLDEPTSSLDPVSTFAIEDLLLRLKSNYTIVFITHDIIQARRISDHLIFMCNGQVIEEGSKEEMFNNPQNEQTRQYLNDEFCEC